LMIALLSPLISAAEADIDLQGFPLFPYEKTRLLLDNKDGMPNDQTQESTKFWNALIKSSLAVVQGSYGSEGSPTCVKAGEAWSAVTLNGAQYALAEPEAPPAMVIPGGFFIPARPSMTDCSSSQRLLARNALPADDASRDGGDMLSLTLEEVHNFTGTPTEALSVLREHMQMVDASMSEGSSTKQLMDELPFDLTRHPMAQSVVAKSMLKRVGDDMRGSAETMRRPGRLVPRLPYLSDEMIAELRVDIEVIERRAAQAASMLLAAQQSTAPPPLTRHHSGLPMPLTRQISTAGSSMLQDALSQLIALLAALEQLKAKETASIASALRQLVTTANSSSEEARGTADGLRFELLRFAGQNITVWFELVAAALLSSQAEKDIIHLNAFISTDATRGILDGVAAIELRCVLVCHLSFCIGDANKLVKTIRELLARRMVADIAVKFAGQEGKVPTRQMLDHALRCGSVNYHESRAHRKLDELVEARERLRSLVADYAGEESSTATTEHTPEMTTLRQRAIVDVAFATCAFDETKTRALLTQSAARDTLIGLSIRGCFYEGKRLKRPDAQTSILAEAASSTSSQSLSAMVHVLQHSAQSLATLLASKRGYFGALGGHGDEAAKQRCFDPRFLVMEFMCGFMLRKRQCELILDFMAMANGGKSGVQQMIMGANSATCSPWETSQPWKIIT